MAEAKGGADREPSPPSQSYDPFDFVFEASRMLASQVSQAQEVASSLPPSSQGTGNDQGIEPLPKEDTEGGGVEVSPEQRVVETGPSSKSSEEEQDEKIMRLEEVNMSLKLTNDNLDEEVAELKQQLTGAQQKLQSLEQSSRELQEEKREVLTNIGIQGWLFKRGAKGPTASVWRRRYFRCDQGSKIYYYKYATEGTPQGHIDLHKVISVQEASPAQQDKNHATFLVRCVGRTYQLQAPDEATMRKWMGTVEYLRDWHTSNSATP